MRLNLLLIPRIFKMCKGDIWLPASCAGNRHSHSGTSNCRVLSEPVDSLLYTCRNTSVGGTAVGLVHRQSAELAAQLLHPCNTYLICTCLVYDGSTSCMKLIRFQTLLDSHEISSLACQDRLHFTMTSRHKKAVYLLLKE